MLTIAKSVAHGSFCFSTEKRHEPLGIEQKMCVRMHQAFCLCMEIVAENTLGSAIRCTDIINAI